MRQAALLLAVAGVAITAGAASADITYMHTITAYDMDNGGAQIGSPFSWSWTRPDGQDPFQTHGDGLGNWQDWDTDGNGIPQNEEPSTAPVHVFGGDVAIDGLGFKARANPIVGLNFNVTAGSTNSAFVIDSVVVGALGGFNGWSAQASAAVTLTKPGTGAGPGNPAGLQSGGAMYTAFFNGNALASEFTNLIDATLFAGMASGSTRTVSGTTGGFLPLPGDPGLNDVRSQFEFTVPARFRAGGTSSYELVPAPAGVGLLALGGLFAARRRRA